MNEPQTQPTSNVPRHLLLPPPPRRVSEDPLFHAAERPKRIFIAIGAVTALLYILMVIWGTQTLRTLHDVQGKVIRAWTAPGIKGTQHFLAFEFIDNGQLHTATNIVDIPMYNRFVGPDGQFSPGPIEVHVSRVGPFYHAMVRRNETPQIMWVAGTFCVLMFPWIPYAIWYLWIAPARKRRICAEGIAMACTVIEKRERRKKELTIYELSYEFTVGPKKIHRKYKTDPGLFRGAPIPEACRSVKPGDHLTAIYLPKNPARHVVYELSGLLVDQQSNPPRGA